MASTVLSFMSVMLVCLHTTSGHNYCEISSRHTMCRYKGIGRLCGEVLANGVDAGDRAEILKIHNALRLKVAVGREEGQPPAADMHLMVWDNELAKIAQRWANQCLVAHDRCRDVRRFPVGQNVHSTSSARFLSYRPEWTKTVGSWFDEVKRWRANHIQPFRPVPGTADYTQLVWATSNRVGCGFTAFKRAGRTIKHYVCNYGPRGNQRGEALYIKGGPCSACPPKFLKCTYGLCSEGHKACIKLPPKEDPVPSSHCPIGTFSYCGRCVSLTNIRRFCTFTAVS